MGQLTTHVLDLAMGVPGAGMTVSLFRLQDERRLITTIRTNADGRPDGPLLEGAEFKPGRYELVFAAGAYFAGRGVGLPDPPFFDDVVVRFAVAAPDQHYHVPLLVSPFGYTTYRGS